MGFVCLWVTARKPHWRAGFSGPWDWAGILRFSGSLWVFVAVEACHLRKGFEGLSALVGSVLKEEVKSGALSAVSNRRRTRLKILYRDGSDLWVLSKRLEKGTLTWPKGRQGVSPIILRPYVPRQLATERSLRSRFWRRQVCRSDGDEDNRFSTRFPEEVKQSMQAKPGRMCKL